MAISAQARVILVTGKGGVGKTTLSAATALTAAARGAGVLLVSTDEAHSLEDVLLQRLGPEPTPIASGLEGLQLDGRYELQRSWSTIADYLRRLLGVTDLDNLHVDELVMVPGLDQLVALSRLRELVDSRRWDAIVVDCAPSADTLRLLALPEVLSWYVDRLLGPRRTVSRWALRKLERTFAVPLPDDNVLTSVTAMTDELTGLRSSLDGGATTARVVVTPQRMVIAEAQRTLSYLALYGYEVDAVLVNRVAPSEREDDPLRERVDTADQLARIDAGFGSLPRLVCQRRATEPLGTEALRQIGEEVFADADPLARLATRPAVEITSRGRDSVVRLPVGGVERDRIGVEHERDELTVTLGAHRRTVMLPDALRRRQVVRAGIDGEHLEVVFGETSYAARG
jgi:arsenite-transporting ATPase